MELLRALKPTKIFLGLLYSTVFSLRVDFHCRVIFTCVKFTFASKIEAINAWKIARKRKSCTSRNFTYKLITLYLASILFTQLKFSCVFTLVKSTRKWKPTLTLKLKPFCFGELKWIFKIYYLLHIQYSDWQDIYFANVCCLGCFSFRGLFIRVYGLMMRIH